MTRAVASPAKKARKSSRRVFTRLRSAGQAWRAPERIPAVDWCTANCWMPPRAAAVRGRYNPALFPYVRGPMEAFMDPNIEEIVLNWATQVGKTAMLLALLSYVAKCDPGPALWGAPNETSCKEFSKMRLVPSFEESPALAPLLLPENRRQALLVELRDMVVFFAWSGSVTRLGEKSIRYLFCTEIDKWASEKSTEADSLALATERTKAFPNAKRIFESTPSIAGSSRIESRYEASDRRHYHVPCPHCGDRQELTFEQIKWPRGAKGKSCSADEARAEAWYECIACEKRIADHHRPKMLAAGEWVAERPTAHCAGFHLNSIYSPLLSFGRIAEAWLRAVRSGHPKEIQNFVNGWLARTYSPPARQTRRDEIMQHRGMGTDLEYPPDTCPIEPEVVVMTVDVQQDTFFYVIRAWDRSCTSAMVAYGEVASFDALYEASLKSVSLAGGGEGSVTHVFIDSGYRTNQVYAVCRQFSWNAVKGHNQSRMKAIHHSETAGVELWSVSDPHFCEQLMYRIKEVDIADPGGWRLHNETDTEYAKHLSCTRQTKKLDAHGNPKTLWISSGKHDYWDCEKYQEAAVTILEIDRLGPSRAPASASASGGEFEGWGDDLNLEDWQ